MRWVNVKPNRRSAVLLGTLPLLVALIAYLAASATRHAANASD